MLLTVEETVRKIEDKIGLKLRLNRISGRRVQYWDIVSPTGLPLLELIFDLKDGFMDHLSGYGHVFDVVKLDDMIFGD